MLRRQWGASPAHLNLAIEALGEAARADVNSQAEEMTSLANPGVALAGGHELTGDAGNASRAIEAFQPACRARATSRPRSCASSPAGLNGRYDLAGDPDDTAAAIKSARRAVQSASRVRLSVLLDNLGTAFVPALRRLRERRGPRRGHGGLQAGGGALPTGVAGFRPGLPIRGCPARSCTPNGTGR